MATFILLLAFLLACSALFFENAGYTRPIESRRLRSAPMPTARTGNVRRGRPGRHVGSCENIFNYAQLKALD